MGCKHKFLQLNIVWVVCTRVLRIFSHVIRFLSRLILVPVYLAESFSVERTSTDNTHPRSMTTM